MQRRDSYVLCRQNYSHAASPPSRKTEGKRAGASTPFSGSADAFRRGDGDATWYGSSSVVSEASSDSVDATVDASSWSSTTRAAAEGGGVADGVAATPSSKFARSSFGKCT